jgi:hypothetical protein
MKNLLILDRAAQGAIAGEIKPDREQVVEALLEAEKTAKQTKQRYSFSQLLGTWRLCFITGTKKTRQRAGIVLGAGRYLPSFIQIQISYSLDDENNDNFNDIETGRVENTVNLGGLKLSLTGPVKFLAKKNILAFDFTYLRVQLGGIKLYEGYIRNGKTTEANFYQESVGKQAFFAYFLVSDCAPRTDKVDRIIAARGRGGGLALWAKE